MTISIDETPFDCVSINVKRELRRTDINYNTQGDMLIDMVRRKYCLEVTFGLMTENELERLRKSCDKIFTQIGFNSPEGYITREFHVMNEPAYEVTKIGEVKMYGGIKLEFKEK